MVKDTAEVWDGIIQAACAPSPGNTPASANGSAVQRRRLKLQATPEILYLPELSRSVAKIDQGLRLAFRELATGKKPWPLFLHGGAGRGKTCAALCLSDHAGGWYRTLPDFLDELIGLQAGKLRTKGPAADGGGQLITPADFWQRVERTNLFVLDELGCRDAVTDFHYLAVKRVLDRRAGRPLVVLSNLNLEAIERVYDDRIASRLAAGTIVELAGTDRRLSERNAL